MKNKKLLVATNIFFVLTTIILMFVVISNRTVNHYNDIIKHDSSSSYKLTNPILDCEFNNEDSGYVIFSGGVIKKVQEEKDKYGLDHISLYFRDLNNGPWIGVGEKEVFSPASLLKVPILIELLHEAERDPSLLNRVIDISPSDINSNVIQNIKPENPLTIGNKYSLLDVAKTMIEQSDNTAVAATMQNIDSKAIGNVFKAIGVPFQDTNTEVDVRVKDYAGFFRILFNASYLSRDMSEKALEILSKSEYNDGIVAGVPKDIIVAHKFGERKIEGDQDTNQLHDCGIVYYPDKPYIICIMTKGNNYIYQSKVIQELSNYIYNEVDKSSKK
ncbi:MAG: serine hydrolase [Verrucomicrobiota bacterium]